MCKISDSLLTKYLQVKEKIHPVELKPLTEIDKSSALNVKDSLVKKFNKVELLNPLKLFRNDSQPKPVPAKLTNPQVLFHRENITVNLPGIYQDSGNISIIEPGSSIENINALKQIPGKQWLGKRPSNGNREAAIIIPEGSDYNKPFELIYYFHGHNGKISTSLTGSSYGLKDQIQNMAKDRNIIVVVPQGPPKELSNNWMNGHNNEDMQKFEEETIGIIKNQLDPRVQISSITVKGHSAGGQPLRNAAVEGKLTANRIDFLDASYGNWASQAYNSFIGNNPDAKFNLIYIPGSQTQADALSLQGQKGVSLIKSKVDHSTVPKQFFSI
jgi:hypothetical protein